MAAKGQALKDLETRLNRDTALRSRFLKDPVGVLKAEGIELTPTMAKSVKEQFKDLQVPKLDKLAQRPRIGIRITITIRF